MRGYLMAAVTAAVAITGSTAAGAAIPGGRAAAGTQLWVEHLKGGEHITLASSAMAVSPGGRMVFLTGQTFFGKAFGAGYQTVAYRAGTGKQLWASRYLGPGTNADTPDAIAVSRHGGTVFVTGYSPGGKTQQDYATVAYRADTGKQLWVSRYNDPANGFDIATAVAVSPDGATVFVTGSSDRRRGTDYATIAYNAATGKRLWISRYHLPGQRSGAASVAVSPDGKAVFVTGSSDDQAATVAYNAGSGKQLWVSRHRVPAFGFEETGPVLVSQGTTVFVTWTSHTRKASDTATVAYKAATGKQLWARHYRSSATNVFYGSSLAISPTGTTVFMTRTTSGSGSNGDDFTTVAYRAATGKQAWTRHFHGFEANSIAVNPHGTVVYVAGSGYSKASFTTVAYNAATGKQLWVGRYYGGATSVLASPTGTAVFATGGSVTADGGIQYTTVAYRS
jgi:outer membrane protein assembly factor BamB